ncbi:MAG: hypothetical protein R2911_38690 [Caldilineaceae bacterium]
MSALTPSRGQLIDAVRKLPLEALPELASFLNYLQFKVESPIQSPKPAPLASGSEFLLSIAGIGIAEADLSERDEEILAKEIDPIRGWSFEREAQA